MHRFATLRSACTTAISGPWRRLRAAFRPTRIDPVAEFRAYAEEHRRELEAALAAANARADEAFAAARAATVAADGSVAQIAALRRQLTALQAIDVGCFHDGGKVILCARVGGRDVVQIIDIRRDMPATMYKEFASSIEQRYGARTAYVDWPGGALPAYGHELFPSYDFGRKGS